MLSRKAPNFMRLFLRLTGAVVLTVLLALMIGPYQDIESASRIWDKAAHFAAFGLILWSLGVLFRRLPRTLAAAVAISIGGGFENVQRFSGRYPCFGFFLADFLGVATALALWALWRGFRPREAFQTSNTR